MPRRDRRPTRTPRSLRTYAAVLAVLFAASSTPTPLYLTYQQDWALPSVLVTVMFAVYPATLLTALLTVGRLSDRWGRRTVTVAALGVQVAALIVLATAPAFGPFIVGRVLQGLATGAATAAAASAVTDLGRGPSAATVNSVAPPAGMAAGVVVAALASRFLPAPAVTTYLMPITLTSLLLVVVHRLPEPGRLPDDVGPAAASTSSSAGVRRALTAVGPGLVAVWALGGMLASLGPALMVRVHPEADALLTSAMFLAFAGPATVAGRPFGESWGSRATVLGNVVAVHAALALVGGVIFGSTVALLLGACLTGVAFGQVSLGAQLELSTTMGGASVAAATSAYYSVCYVAMSVPSVAAGLAADTIGIDGVPIGYAAVVVPLAVASCVLTLRPALTCSSPRFSTAIATQKGHQ